MLEHSIYSILSPEGFAAILWKDGTRAKEAAQVMKITSEDLKNFEIIDDIINEPLGGAHKDIGELAKSIKKLIINDLQELEKQDLESLLNKRYIKFRKIGEYQ